MSTFAPQTTYSDMLNTKHPVFLPLFLMLCLFALFQPIGLRPLRAEEPRRSIVAMEMEYSGNYLVPKVNDMYYYNKPPLYNWVLLGFFKLCDSYAEWVVRLPTVVSLILTAILNFFFVRRYLPQKTALWSSLFYVLSADILLYFSMLGEIDIFYSLLVYVQVFAIFHFFQHRQWLLLFGVSYLFTALGVLTKGVPSLAFQALTLLTIFSYNKQFWRLFWWQHIAGILLLFGLVGSYFYAYAQTPDSGDAIVYMIKLFVESSSRTGLETGIGSTLTNFFRVPTILLKLFLPWTFLMVLLFQKGVKELLIQQPLLKFSFFFIVVNLLVYLISPGTRDRYLYMFLPFVGIIVAYFYQHFEKIPSRPHRILRVLVLGMLVSVASSFVVAA
ncbi:MAG: glycosyltransferase family 39 protein, partial [Bacteroidota bacterium]